VSARAAAALPAALAALLLAGCPPRIEWMRPEPRPGQSAEDLAAAARVLEQVRDGVALVEVTALTDAGSQTHTTIGFVLTADGGIVCAAGPLAQADGAAGDEIVYLRTVRAIFRAGTDEERGYDCTVVRESQDVGLALLQAGEADVTPLELGGEVQAGEPVFALAEPVGLGRLSAQAGQAVRYEGEGAARMLRCSARGLGGAGGLLVDGQGRVIGLNVGATESDEGLAIPVARIATWLESPPEDEAPPADPGTSLGAMLESADLIFRESDGRFELPYDNDTTVLAAQLGDLIVISMALPPLPGGSGLNALRWNYADPYGGLALTPDDDLVWLAKVPVQFATAEYLKEVCRVASARGKAWIDDPTDTSLESSEEYYPGGDTEALTPRLAAIVEATGLPHEPGGERSYRMTSESGPPVYTNVYRGEAYVYAFSGGMPGEDAAEQERIARELLARNWHDPLGRLALDEYDDLAWEALVPMDYLQPAHLAMLARTCAAQVAELQNTYGDVPFNEQE